MLLKISRLFIYVSLCAVLLVNRSLFFPFITGKQIFFRVSVELAFAFFLCYAVSVYVSRKETTRRAAWQAIKMHARNPIVLCLFGFAVALFVAVLTSPNPIPALWSNYERGDGAFQILHYVLFAFLIKVLFTEQKHLHRLLIAQLIVSIPVCFYAFGQMFSDPSSTTFVASSSRVSGTLGNPSYLAAYLMFSLAIIFYFLLRNKDIFIRTGLIILGLIQIFLMIKAQTLGAALGVLIGLLVFAVHLTWTTENEKIKNTGLIIGGVVAALALFFIGTRSMPFWQHIPLFNRVTDIGNAIENVQPRFWTWQSAISGIAERPVTGWGSENFPVPFDKYYNPLHYGQESFFDRTHNLFLEYLIEGGILAFIPWVLIFYFYYRQLRRRKNSAWKSAAVAVPLMYFIQGIFLFDVLPIYIPLFLFLIFIVNTNGTAEDNPTLSEIAGHGTGMYALHGVIIAGLLAAAYTTGYMPLKRNLLIVQALTDGNALITEGATKSADQLTKKPADVFAEFRQSITYGAPIGRGEAIEMYQKFVIDLISAISQIKDIASNQGARTDVISIMQDLNATIDMYPHLVPGVKDRFVNGSTNIRVGVIFNVPELVQRGRTMLETDLAQNPKRIELMTNLIQLGQATKDQALLNQWLPTAFALRPDLFVKPSSTISTTP